MSAVVLRCPNCGTTKGTTGECEACHESEVRYYCTNHTPGRWLEAPECSQCGARFGESAPPRAAGRPVERPVPGPRPVRPPAARVPGARVPRPAPVPLPPTAVPPPEPSHRRGGRPRVDEAGWGRGARPLPDEESVAPSSDAGDEPGFDPRADPRRDPRSDLRRDPRAEMLARWQEMLRAAGRGRAARRASPPDIDVAPIARSVGGCLMRLVFLVVLFILGMVLFGGMFFQIGY